MKLDLASEPGLKIKRLDGMPEGVICLEIDGPGDGKSYLVSAEKSQRVSVAGTEIEGQLALIRMGKDGKVVELEVVK